MMHGRWLFPLVAIGLSVLALPPLQAQTTTKPKDAKTAKTARPAADTTKASSTKSAKATKEPRSPSEELPPPSTAAASPAAPVPAAAPATSAEAAAAAERNYRRLLLVSGISIFVLAVFVGFEVISKVPATLHTPLMSGSNAISGITVVGAIIAASTGWGFASFLGFFAVIVAMINVVGGFLVTHRMLLMFKRK